MKKNRLVCLLLAMTMLIALIPVSVAASTNDSENVTWELADGTLTISGTGDMENWDLDNDIIPPWFDYHDEITSVVITNGVTSIGDFAFCSCSELTDVTIPNSVTRIGNVAFYGCVGLESITIPDSVTYLGGAAFGFCESLTTATIGNGVSEINASLFTGCDALTSVTIGNSVASIGFNAFSGCNALESITIPDGVESIGESAFYGCGFESVTIPDSVTSIGLYAFNYCRQLTLAIIGNGTESIGKRAFANCDNLKSVSIGNGVTSIGEDAFRDCIALENVSLGNKVETIGMTAFYGCESLKSLTIPDSVTSMGLYAFSDCRGLTSLTLGNGCTDLTAGLFCDCKSLTSVSIPNSVTSMSTAFYGCSGLKTVTIPNSVETIWKNVFGECTSLTDVYYIGTAEDWAAMTIMSGNDYLTSANIHYVSADDPYSNVVAKVGNSGYSTLEDAVENAPSQGTVTLLSDIDYTKKKSNTISLFSASGAAENARTVDLKDLTLDLNGYMITAISGTVTFGGDGATIKNGTFDLAEKNSSGGYEDGSYALVIDNGALGRSTTGTVNIQDVTVDGGVNVSGATVSLDNVTAHTTTTKSYALLAENNALLTINSGSFEDTQSDGKGVIATGKGSEGGAVVKVAGGNFTANNELVYDTEENGVQILGGTFNTDPTSYISEGTDAANDSGVWTVSSAEIGVGSAEFYVSLTPQDDILINFYANNLKDASGHAEANPSKFKVAYTFRGVTREETLSNAETNRIVVAKCAAKELSDVVNIRVYYSGELIESIDYSAKDYCDAKIANNESEKLTDLCNALLDYGAYAQQRFGYNAGGSYYNAEIEEIVIPEAVPNVESAAGIVSKIGVSLSLESKTKVNVYFVPVENLSLSDYSATVDGQSVTLTQMSDGSIRINSIPGLVAKDLDKVYDIEITAQGIGTMTLQYSPLVYAFSKQNDAKEGGICKALYHYHLAAQEYFNE